MSTLNTLKRSFILLHYTIEFFIKTSKLCLNMPIRLLFIETIIHKQEIKTNLKHVFLR